MKVPETIRDQQLETLVGAAALVPSDVLQGDRPLLLPGPPAHPGPPSPNPSLPEKAEKVADQGDTKAQGSFREIFYFFETRGEKVLLFLAILLSAAQGVGMPIFSFILGSMTETFSDSNPENVSKDMNQQLYIMIGLAAATLVVAFLASSIWSYLAGKQSSRIKTVYFRKLLYQRTSWYDKRPVDQIAANFQDQVSSLTAIFSDKIHMFFMCLATVSGGILVAFIRGWLLTLYILALCPLAFGCLAFFIYAVRKREQVSRESYGEAGAITDECFTFLKTIKSLSGEEHEIARYERSIAKSRDESIRYS